MSVPRQPPKELENKEKLYDPAIPLEELNQISQSYTNSSYNSPPHYEPTTPPLPLSPLSPLSQTRVPEGAEGTREQSIYEDLLNVSYMESSDVKQVETQGVSVEEFVAKDFKELDSSNVVNYHVQKPNSNSVVTTYSLPRVKQGQTIIAKPCRYFMQGFCQFGARCRFFHSPSSQAHGSGSLGNERNESNPMFSTNIFVARKRNNRCHVEGCQAFAKVDFCLECCNKYNYCENRPCPNQRTNQGEEPTLCCTCFQQEKAMVPRMCRSQGCLNNCLSFYTHCRDCFSHSKRKKCFNLRCKNLLQNPLHRFCRSCHMERLQIQSTMDSPPTHGRGPRKSQRPSPYPSHSESTHKCE